MTNVLSAGTLMAHVRALAGEIGPRPAGHWADLQARDYIRRALNASGFRDDEIEEMPFPSPDTWGYMFFAPALLTLAGNALGALGKLGKLAGGAASLASAYHLWRSVSVARQPLSFLYPKRRTANLVVRIPAAKETLRRVVLIGHVDSNKQRATFAPPVKRFLPALMSLGTLVPLANGLAQLAEAMGSQKARTVRRASFWGVLSFLPLLLLDEKERHVDGANDNATAVACLLGLGAHLKSSPLKHTEVWLAFTGAEEVGGLGMHELLDAYGGLLGDAWFIDFEMVGARDVIYVTRHGLSYLNQYRPDVESLALAEETSRRYPELDIAGRSLVIAEEVGALRSRGYRGICIAGVGPDGWLENWHRYQDNIANIVPSGIERAARFALAMMQTLDSRQFFSANNANLR